MWTEILARNFILSQPNNKTTISVVGLRQSNRWEHHHPPTTTGTQNYMIEQKQSKTQKTKVISLYQETPKQFLNPTPTPKIACQGPKTSKMTPKLSQNQMSESKVTQKMKVVHLHEQTLKQCLDPCQTPKIDRQGPKNSNMTPKLSQN